MESAPVGLVAKTQSMWPWHRPSMYLCSTTGRPTKLEFAFPYKSFLWASRVFELNFAS